MCSLTTLGAGEASGSLYVLDVQQGPEIEDWDRIYPLPFQIQARVKTRGSIWTAEASPNGIAASLGTELLPTSDIFCMACPNSRCRDMHSIVLVKAPCFFKNT